MTSGRRSAASTRYVIRSRRFSRPRGWTSDTSTASSATRRTPSESVIIISFRRGSSARSSSFSEPVALIAHQLLVRDHPLLGPAPAHVSFHRLNPTRTAPFPDLVLASVDTLRDLRG